MNKIEVEMRWLDYWNELFDRLDKSELKTVLRLSDCAELSLEDCKGWIQDQVYANLTLTFGTAHLRGKSITTVGVLKV